MITFKKGYKIGEDFIIKEILDNENYLIQNLKNGKEGVISNKNFIDSLENKKSYPIFIGGEEYKGFPIFYDGKIVGGIDIDYSVSLPEIRAIYLRPKFRGLGIAYRELMKLPNGNYYVKAIPSAKKFWEKIGVNFERKNEDTGLWEGFFYKNNNTEKIKLKTKGKYSVKAFFKGSQYCMKTIKGDNLKDLIDGYNYIRDNYNNLNGGFGIKDLLPGNGDISDKNGQKIANLSYNGKAWDLEGNEIFTLDFNKNTSTTIYKGYHGTDSTFEKFDKNFRGSANGNTPTNKAGIFFSDKLEIAKTFGKNIIEAEIELSNPMVIDVGGVGYGDPYKGYDKFKFYLNDLLEKRDTAKHDGLIVKNYKDCGKYGENEILGTQIIPFYEFQIKVIKSYNTSDSREDFELLFPKVIQLLKDNKILYDIHKFGTTHYKLIWSDMKDPNLGKKRFSSLSFRINGEVDLAGFPIKENTDFFIKEGKIYKKEISDEFKKFESFGYNREVLIELYKMFLPSDLLKHFLDISKEENNTEELSKKTKDFLKKQIDTFMDSDVFDYEFHRNTMTVVLKDIKKFFVSLATSKIKDLNYVRINILNELGYFAINTESFKSKDIVPISKQVEIIDKLSGIYGLDRIPMDVFEKMMNQERERIKKIPKRNIIDEQIERRNEIFKKNSELASIPLESFSSKEERDSKFKELDIERDKLLFVMTWQDDIKNFNLVYQKTLKDFKGEILAKRVGPIVRKGRRDIYVMTTDNLEFKKLFYSTLDRLVREYKTKKLDELNLDENGLIEYIKKLDLTKKNYQYEQFNFIQDYVLNKGNDYVCSEFFKMFKDSDFKDILKVKELASKI